MDPRAFCEEVVWLNVGYLVTTWDDVRLAFNAVASLDALAAHMYFWCIENGKLSKAECSDDVGYRVGLAKRNDEFRLLRDVAKLQKHVMLTRGNPLVRQSRQVGSMLHGFSIEDMDGNVNKRAVAVETGTDDSPVIVSDLVSRVLTFLEEELDAIGVPVVRHHAGWENRRRDRLEPPI